MALPKHFAEYFLIGFVCLLIGYGTGAVISTRKNSMTLGDTVAVKWSDGIRDNPSYGAHIFLTPYMTNKFRGHAVWLQVYIGRKNEGQRFTLPHRLGLAKTPDLAARQWSRIEWLKNGLHVGEGNHSTFIPIEEFRSP
ncbi:MAG: hypothetical protein CMO66_01410 [Verrucomicrobiales bacterium]|nr:hypothetical protein [Verrucomicrobiales bacterium]